MENSEQEKNIVNSMNKNFGPIQLNNKLAGTHKIGLMRKKVQNNQNGLSNIVELTEQYEPQKTMASQNRHQLSIKQSEKPQDAKNNPKKLISAILNKTINCLFFTCHKIYSQFRSEEMNVAQSQISDMLTKLRKRKDRRIRLLPQQSSQVVGKRTLVLDLDQTLVSLSHRKPRNFDFRIQIQSKGLILEMFITKRFGLDSFLFQMSQMYEVIVFSSLKSDLVEEIMSLIDPKKYVSYFLSRQHCVVINQTYFIKPIRDLGRDTRNVIAVDTYGISASLNPENLYKIERFRGSSKDRKLIKLGYFLKYLYENNDIKEVVPIELHRKQFETKQIQICDKENTQRFKEEKMSHRKRTSEVQPILSKQEESSISVLPVKI